jgi:O-antigen/teichoic acid export membrane protein
MDTSDQSATGGDAAGRARTGTYRSGFAFGGLGFVLATLLGIVSMVATSRLYGVRVIGQFALVSAPVGVLWVLSTVKEQQALIKEIAGLPPRDPQVTRLFAAVFTFSAGLSAAVAVPAMVASWFVFRGPLHAAGLIPPAFVSIAGYVLVTNTGWNIDSILSAFVAGREIFWVRLHEVLSFIAIAMALGALWPTVWGLVIATIGGFLTALVHRVVVVRAFVRTRLSRDEYRDGLRLLPRLLRFGLKATPGQIAQGASQQGGVWVLGALAPVAVVGAYSRAQMIPQRLQQASMRISEVLYPTLVGRHLDGDGHGFDRALIDSIRYEAIAMLGIAATVGGAARSVLQIFGPGFARASTALALLALFPALASITVTQTQALWAVDRPGTTSVIAIARAAVTLGLLVLLTPTLGIDGPAIALLGGYLVVIGLSGLMLRSVLTRRLRATWPVRERLALVGAYAIAFLLAHVTERTIAWPAGLPAALACGAVAFLLVFVLAGGVNERDRRRLGEVLGGSGRDGTSAPSLCREKSADPVSP